MNDRKKHVIMMAHQLFIEKGFQATSIQDILDYSGISKGTFYNYFSSKNELLIALLKELYFEMEQAQNKLLVGQDASDLEIFIKQVEVQTELNRKNKLISLLEEVNFSNDKEIIHFIRIGQLKILKWLHSRFLDIFGKEKEPYILDCAIMFTGILHINFKYYSAAHEKNINISKVVRYSVSRIVSIMEDVAKSKEQLFEPQLLGHWLPKNHQQKKVFQRDIDKTITALKSGIKDTDLEDKYLEFLDFIQDELLHAKKPRRHLVENVFNEMKKDLSPTNKKEIFALEVLISTYFQRS
ncbi:TetR/AcrR family transcriptional regulator [Caldibacillus lycopersici]|uniref:TetR/AcrR family transcriptional regulator n=1 Tax=Perspicuibacillus lycopersici TaxID=1325689 RepID=A0AAE3IYX9_9BACI|nr:TetR/AcrR family transcriptional regulator [Perspicuibacillus lycopersici]MCU9614610.1 TetR/AcrR family transcriptional regulator [Perspicuibacillus lycopersici]